MPLLRSILLSCVFCAAALAVSVPVSSRFTPGESWQRRMDFFRRHHEQFDFVVIGSSHVYRNVDPRVLEKEFSAPGCEPRGFNVGVAGYGGHGIDYTLRRLGDTLTGKVVLIEAFSYSAAMRPDAPGRYAARDVQWHTLHQTASALRTAFEQAFESMPPSIEPHTLGDRIILLSQSAEALLDVVPTAVRSAAPHLRLWGERILPYGLVWRLNGPELEEPDGDPPGVDLMNTRGFNPLAEKDYRMQLSPAEWDEHVASLIASRKLSRASGPNDPAFDRQLRFLASVKPRRVFYVIFPHAYGDSARWVARFAGIQNGSHGPPGIEPVLLDYNRPGTYPEWFTYEARFDSSHLTEAVTNGFTHQLGRDVLGHFDSGFCPGEMP